MQVAYNKLLLLFHFLINVQNTEMYFYMGNIYLFIQMMHWNNIKVWFCC